MTTNDQLLTIPEIATRLGISTEGVRRRIATGQLRAIKLGPANSAIRVASSDLHTYLEEHPRVPSSHKAPPRRATVRGHDREVARYERY